MCRLCTLVCFPLYGLYRWSPSRPSLVTINYPFKRRPPAKISFLTQGFLCGVSFQTWHPSATKCCFSDGLFMMSLVKERKDDKSQSLMMPVIKAGWFLSFHFVVFALPHTSLLSSHSSLISSHGAVGFHLPQPCCQNKGLELREIAEKFAILAAYRGRQTARIKGA